jgi:hypothetical protein
VNAIGTEPTQKRTMFAGAEATPSPTISHFRWKRKTELRNLSGAGIAIKI